MQAYQVSDIGRPPEIVDIPVPSVSPGEVLLSVEACGLNFADLLIARGEYQERPSFPVILGMEVAGRVVEADSQGRFAPGDRIAAFVGHGGLAEYAVVPTARCVAIPDEMPSVDAAAFLIAYGTSHVALAHRADLRHGETLLVLGAAGGVGLTAVELGRVMGARVLAVARGTEKLEVARRAGADLAFDADASDLTDRLKAAGGADVVYDPVGGDLFRTALKACRPEARYLTIGYAGGLPDVRANHLLVKNISLIGLYWGGYLAFRPEVVTDSLTELFALYRAGRLRPHVSHVLPLIRASEGMDLLRRRASTGKIVIVAGREANRG